MSKLHSIFTFLFHKYTQGISFCFSYILFLRLTFFGIPLILWQSILFLSSLLKRIDRLLQFDRCIHLLRTCYNIFYQKILVIDSMYLEMACVRLMPSYNGILTISCIRTLTQIGLKLSGFIPLVSVFVVFHFLL